MTKSSDDAGDEVAAPYGIGVDQHLGSFLERWLTQDTGPYCRFCRVEPVGDVAPPKKFCSDGCREQFQVVMEARSAIGQRDLQQRGYD